MTHHSQWLIEQMAQWPAQPLLLTAATYDDLIGRIGFWQRYLDKQGVAAAGEVVSLDGDYSASVALLVALIDRGTIVVPLTRLPGPARWFPGSPRVRDDHQTRQA